MSRQPISAACTLGTMPLTIRPTTSSRQKQRLGRAAGRRQHLVQLGRQVEHDHVAAEGLQLADVGPEPGHEQGVADPQLLVR